MERARYAIANDRWRERRQQETATQNNRRATQQQRGRPDRRRTAALPLQTTPAPPTEPPPTATAAPAVEDIRNLSGLIADQLLSQTPMSEFMDMEDKFRWLENWTDAEMDHRDLDDRAVFPCKVEGIIGRTRNCKVIAGKTNLRQHGFGDCVAIKQLTGFNQDDDRRMKTQLGERERRILKDLSHIHVVAFLGSFTWLDSYYIITYPVAKWHLLRYMKSASNPQSDPAPGQPHPKRVEMLEQLRGFMPCLCEALSYLHSERGVRHKDIKPTNILVDNFGNVLLTDFGISTKYSSPSNMESTGMNPPQTMQYAAPEVLREERRGPQSDIFSLGCVFLEMCTVLCGHTLFDMQHYIEFKRPRGRRDPEKRTDLEGKYALSLTKALDFIEQLRRGISESTAAEDEAYKPTVNAMNEVSQMLHERPDKRPSLSTVSRALKIAGQECRCQHRRPRNDAPNGAVPVAEDMQSIGSLTSIDEESSTDGGDAPAPLPPNIDAQDWATAGSTGHSIDVQRIETPNTGDPNNGSQSDRNQEQEQQESPRCLNRDEDTSNATGRLVILNPQDTMDEDTQLTANGNLNTATETDTRIGGPTPELAQQATIPLPPILKVFNYYRRRDSNEIRSDLRGPALRYDYINKTIEFIQLETFNWEPEGFLFRLPNDLSGQFHLPGLDKVEVIDLWERMSWWSNVRRMTRWPGWPVALKYVWVTSSDFSEDQLQDFVLGQLYSKGR